MILALQLIGGLTILLIGGEALIRGAAQIASRFGLSRLIVGLVIAGFGTSLPELVVCVRAASGGAPGLAVGNVIGSNIANTLLILAIAALIRPIDPVHRDLKPEGFVLVFVTAGVMLLALQETVPAWQGGVMLALLFGLVTLRFQLDRTAETRRRAAARVIENPAPIIVRGWLLLLIVATGLVALPLGAELFVRGATKLASTLGVSNALIGLSIVAVGTSLPELSTSTVAAVRGETSIGYGNIVGSNLFNLLGIFGASTLAGPMHVPAILIYLDGSVMILATAIVLWFLKSHAQLSRSEAAIMLCLYTGYVTARYIYALG